MRNATLALARCDVSVLIQGEAGTGAEEWAREIVRTQRADDALFVGELAADAMEWVGGAPLTDALRAVGDRGGTTLCIPSIERLPLRLQRQLIQTFTYELAGGDRRRRVIATSNVALEERVRIGGFRRDLYQRVAAVQLNVPPLRDRREDIAAIIDAYADLAPTVTASDPITFGPDALAALAAYDWPGNVGELVRTLEAVRRTAGPTMMTAKRITAIIGGYSQAPPVGSVALLRDVERDYLTMVVARCRGNRTQAARLLGIARKTLARKLREHDADTTDPG